MNDHGRSIEETCEAPEHALNLEGTCKARALAEPMKMYGGFKLCSRACITVHVVRDARRLGFTDVLFNNSDPSFSGTWK